MRKRSRTPEIIEAMSRAQQIAFGPFVFAACVSAKRLGILKVLGQSGGLTREELAERMHLSPYGVKVLADMLVPAGVLRSEAGKLFLTKVGECLEWDPLTGVNLDFTADVCFKPLAHLEEAIREERPAGLSEFGPWPTVYEAMPHLPPQVLASWLRFDHYYSETAFREALKHLAGLAPRRILDIGGNTGRFCELALKALPQASVTLIDLPGQCAMARSNAALAGLGERFATAPVDWLDPEAMPETGGPADLIWMSQFLDCFSPDECRSILARAQRLLAPDGTIAVLECILDNQDYEAAHMSLAATSLYFTAVANGNSRFFRRDELAAILADSGLAVRREIHPIGASHTLFLCRSAREDGAC